MKETLFGLDKKGGFKVWSIAVENVNCDNAEALVTIAHGKEGGVQTEKVESFIAGKQGRTPYEQAISEAEGRVKKQIDKGYRKTKEELSEVPLLAMLAADYNKVGHRILYDCGVYVSDKLDGVRCMAKCTGEGITLESRTGQRYSLPHIEEELLAIMVEGDVLDGEIYLHGEVLQDITSAVKRTDTQKEVDKAKKKHAQSYSAEGLQQNPQEYEAECERAYLEALKIHNLRTALEFIVFDLPASPKLFDERVHDLENYATRFKSGGKVKELDYRKVDDELHMKELHRDAVSRGYEGVMLRNSFGKYESGKRSGDLQKYKTFVDSEFLILDVVPAKDNGSTFLVRNDLNGLTFNVTLGDMTQRKHQLDNKYNYIGKYLTVQYQNRYKETLLPQFPSGKVIRDGSVINGKFTPYE